MLPCSRESELRLDKESLSRCETNTKKREIKLLMLKNKRKYFCLQSSKEISDYEQIDYV